MKKGSRLLDIELLSCQSLLELLCCLTSYGSVPLSLVKLILRNSTN